MSHNRQELTENTGQNPSFGTSHPSRYGRKVTTGMGNRLKRIWPRVAGWALWPLLRTLGRMLRWQTSDIRELDALYRSDRGAIYALWHGRMFFPMYAARHLGICVLVSEHQDGELIATVLRRFGCNVVRGSTTHGGLAALLQMIRGWRPGVRYAITPDGPRGPRETVQPGVVHLARRLGLPIVPITGAASRCFTFKSWDRLMLPWPFSRAAFIAGEPLEVPAEASPETLSAVASELQRRLLAASRQAERVCCAPGSW